MKKTMLVIWYVFLASLFFGAAVSWSPIPNVSLYMQDIILLFFIILVIFLNSKSIKKPLLFKPLVLFIGSCVVSLAVNIHYYSFLEISTGSLYLWRFIYYLGVYTAVLWMDIPSEKIIQSVSICGIIYSILGIIQLIFYPSLTIFYYLGWDPHLWRIYGVFLDPNFTGIILTMTTLVTLIYINLNHHHFIWIIGLVLQIITIIMTFSRSSYLSLLIAGFVVLFSIRPTIKQLTVWLMSLVMVTSMILIILPSSEGNNLMRLSSSEARIYNWQHGLELWLQKPIFGHGFNMLRYVQKDLIANYTEIGDNHAGSGLDNSIEFILATAGICGFIFYGYLMYSILKIHTYIKVNKYKTLYQTLIKTIILALLIHSFFANSLFYSWVMILLWIIIAAVEKEVFISRT